MLTCCSLQFLTTPGTKPIIFESKKQYILSSQLKAGPMEKLELLSGHRVLQLHSMVCN